MNGLVSELVYGKGIRMRLLKKNEYDPALSELFLANTAVIIQFLEKNQLRFCAEYIQQLKEFYLYQAQLIHAGIKVEDVYRTDETRKFR